MEDSIGTIFYIVLAIIALIITALNKKRKLKATAPAMPKEEKEDFDPFEAFEQDSMEPATEVSDQTITDTPKAPSVESKLESFIDEGVSVFNKKSSVKERFENRFNKEVIKEDKKEQPPGDSSEFYDVQQEESELDKIIKEFDLKKAIIHSEIINRKEF